MGTRVIILDEPTVGLDKEYRNTIMRILRSISTDRIILIATNDMRIITESDSVLVLDNGQIVQHGEPFNVILDDGFIFKSQIAMLVKCLERLGLTRDRRIESKHDVIRLLRRFLC